MKNIAYSAESMANLKKIYDHTKKHFSISKAEVVIKSIFEKISTLEKFPNLGKTSQVSPLVKELTVERNTIYYQITEESVDIIFIKPRRTTI
jgi:plasmid stabilization system protein ParE